MPTKICLVKAMVFPVVMYGCENWTIKLSAKELMLWSVVLEKTLESPLDYMEIQPVNPKGNQSWIFIRRINDEVETPILWPPDAKNWLIWKDPDDSKDWRREKKVTTEVEMVEWHHQLSGHEVWVSSGRWWWTGKPSVLPSRRSQKVGIWLSNWTKWNIKWINTKFKNLVKQTHMVKYVPQDQKPDHQVEL